jgi:DNA repair protein RadD
LSEPSSATADTSRLRHALIRLGEPTLQNYVGPEVVKYANLMGDKISAVHLADVLIERYGGQGLLESQPQILRDLLQGLPYEEATQLEELWSGTRTTDPWDILRKERLPLPVDRIQHLCTFFAIPWLAPAPPEPPRPGIAELCGAYPLYWYQSRTLSRALSALASGDRRALLHMPTGSGKTRLAMALSARLLIASHRPAVVVWLAHSEELCDQAAEEFARCWMAVGERQVALGRYYGSYDFELGSFSDGLIVAGLAKLYSRMPRLQTALFALKSRAILVVMDEAHQATAPTYQDVLQYLAPLGGQAALLGLSATPGRSRQDIEQDRRLADVFARTKIVLDVPEGANPVEFLQREKYLAIPEYKFIPYKPSVTLSDADKRQLALGLDITEETIRKLGDDDTRNLLLISEISKRVADGAKIIVFACSVAHATLLADTLAMKGIRAAAVSALTPAGRRRHIVEDFRSAEAESLQVLVNFAILSAGFDAPKTNVVVVARPTDSVTLYSQMIGRAMRGPRANGNTHCAIITVQDQIPGFRSIYESFCHWDDAWDGW